MLLDHPSNFFVKELLNYELDVFVCRDVFDPHLSQQGLNLLVIDLYLLVLFWSLLLFPRCLFPTITDGVLAFATLDTFNIFDVLAFLDKLFEVESTFETLTEIIFLQICRLTAYLLHFVGFEFGSWLRINLKIFIVNISEVPFLRTSQAFQNLRAVSLIRPICVLCISYLFDLVSVVQIVKVVPKASFLGFRLLVFIIVFH